MTKLNDVFNREPASNKDGVCLQSCAHPPGLLERLAEHIVNGDLWPIRYRYKPRGLSAGGELDSEPPSTPETSE
jgi:hypothetical protein